MRIMKEYTIDATNRAVGRVASEAAMFLMGKDTPAFRKNVVPEVKVTIENASKIKFDPKKLIHEWNLKGTLFLGAYKFRIIAPIYFQGKLVSYQGRDITEKSPLRYKTCPKTLEILHHKHCLYGIDKAKSDYIVVTEGITDVWRLGPGAVATFGIQWNLEQAKLLMNYKRVFIMFDKQPQAKQQAEKLANFLALTSIEVHIITLDNSDDPAEMTQYEADKLMTDLCNNIF